jgi:hypothetical protein
MFIIVWCSSFEYFQHDPFQITLAIGIKPILPISQITVEWNSSSPVIRSWNLLHALLKSLRKAVYHKGCSPFLMLAKSRWSG